MRQISNFEFRVSNSEGFLSGFIPRGGSISVFLLLSVSSVLSAEPAKPSTDFFETKVRPIFADNCYKCHSPAKGKVKAGLELDWKGGWLKGGDSGPAIVPGDPEKSLLIKAVRYTDPDLQMPPKGEKLSTEQIDALVEWVKMGAPDPRALRPGSEAGTPKYGGGSGKDHWAFKPITKATPPEVRNSAWVKNDIDRFVLAKLETKGMKPNDAADKRTLIRRAYYDLIGLPPTPEETESFLADNSTNAFEKIVDKLLASPRYGERWARHWLDVARYSDTKGQFNRQRESSIYPYAWTYRDYVIKSFNDDKPYNRFVFEQLASDQINSGKDRPALAALGFLTLGDHFNGNQSDILNDRIDVTSKAFLGLTVSCARCHDHKFDPIPQADYYSLHGIFASCIEPAVKPEISDPKTNPQYNDYLAKRQEMNDRIQTLRTQNIATVFGDYRRLAGVYLYATQIPAKDRDAYLKKNGADPDLAKNWQQVSQRAGPQGAPIFGPWNAMARIPEARFPMVMQRMAANIDSNERARQWNAYIVQALKANPPRSLGEAATLYGNLFARNDPAWQGALSAFLGEAALRALPPRQRQQFFVLREQSDRLEMVHPGAPARAATLMDGPQPKDSPIFIRGEAENPGDVVPRRFLEVLSGPSRPAFRNGSGRFELAQAIVSKSNPLTPRVIVNRVWQHHFGEGFVITPDDFGTQSEPPSHPELLDYLATRFMEEGWSLKKLHKQILMSATWQQSSRNNSEYAEKDPFNRFLWRANVRRLEFEPLRDSVLYLGGNLDLTVGGKPVDLSEGTRQPQRRGAGAALNRAGGGVKMSIAPRRTIYGYVDRGDLFEQFNVFDFANPDAPMGKRYETIVPQQALFLMNSPLVIEQVRNVVNRDEFKEQTTDAGRIRYLYELFFQRPPSAEETREGEEFVNAYHGLAKDDVQLEAALVGDNAGPPNRRKRPQNQSPPASAKSHRPLDGWQEYAHALLLTNEAAFVN